MPGIYKLLALFCALGVAARPAVAQAALKVGDQLPDFVLPHVLNAPAGTFAAADARGKVLVLEFWSTACSPCIPALLHLADLQRQHPAELQVVGIAPESEARLRKFLALRPVALPLASAPGPAEAINQLFPHRMVPHTVVADRRGRIVAITSPEYFTEQALADAAAGRPLHLPLKQDAPAGSALSVFVVDSATRYAVSVRPFIQGLPGMMRRWRQGPFAGRRLTAVNLDLASLFQLAYEVSPARVQNQLPDSLRRYDDLARVCFDLVVPPGRGAELLPTLRNELRRYVPVAATWVPVTQPVYVLRCARPGQGPPASAKAEEQTFNGDAFRMTGAKLEFLRDYLENELRRPVVDETGLTGRYDITFTAEQENKKPALVAALARFGLELVEAPRPIQLLRLTLASAGGPPTQPPAH